MRSTEILGKVLALSKNQVKLTGSKADFPAATAIGSDEQSRIIKFNCLNSSTVSRRHSIATDKTDREAARKTQLDNLFKYYQTRIAILHD